MNDNGFPLEEIDEQTEQAPGSLSPDHARPIRALREYYCPLATKNAHSLERVWARLEQRQEQLQRQQDGPQASSRPMPIHQKRDIRLHKVETRPVGEGSWQRSIGLLAAIICILLLVGSMAALFTLIRQNKSIPLASRHYEDTLAPSSPGIYLGVDAGTTSQIIKVDAKSKRQLWSQDVPAGIVPSPVVHGNTVYFSINVEPDQHYVYAIDANNGAIRWHTDLGASYYQQYYPEGDLATPVIADGLVYVTARSTKLFALDAVSGRRLWTYDSHMEASLFKNICNNNPVAMSQGVAYGAVCNLLYAVDARTGRLLWTIDIENTQILNAPQVVDGIIYLSSYQKGPYPAGQVQTGYVYAYSTKNGALLWRFSAGSLVQAPPTVVDGVVYIGSDDKHVYALQASNGATLWQYDTGGRVFDSPLVANGVVYVDEQGNPNEFSGQPGSVQPADLAIAAPTGKLVWRNSSFVSVQILAIQNGVLYVGDRVSGAVYAYSAEDGRELWHQRYGRLLKDFQGTVIGSPPLITVVP